MGQSNINRPTPAKNRLSTYIAVVTYLSVVWTYFCIWLYNKYEDYKYIIIMFCLLLFNGTFSQARSYWLLLDTWAENIE